MSDTNPEDEVGDVPGPTDRMIQSPHPDAGGNLVAETEKTERGSAGGDRKSDPPPARRWLFDHARNPLRKPAKITPVQNQRYTRERPLHGRFAADYVWYGG